MEAVTPVKVSDDHERIYEEWGKFGIGAYVPLQIHVHAI